MTCFVYGVFHLESYPFACKKRQLLKLLVVERPICQDEDGKQKLSVEWTILVCVTVNEMSQLKLG